MTKENTERKDEGDKILYMQMGKAKGNCTDGLLLPGVTDMMVEVEGKAKCHMVV